MKTIIRLSLIVALVFLGISAYPQELPRPVYDNSTIVAVTYSLTSSPEEIDYIKSQFGNGIYAPLYFTHFLGIDMNWAIDPADADIGIQSFKSYVENLISKSKSYEVGLHLVISYGLARAVNSYKAAKEEDIRNAQWYNDNNLAAADQLSDTMNDKVFGTLSRYARKLREFHEAKITAMMSFLKQKQDENPDLIIILSGPGEVELNYNRINHAASLQDYFCDYSPFAVLEFRDWLRHTGMYGSTGKYAGEGYSAGGIRYQGGSGLANFNADFGSNFTTWDLKYYNWNLGDSFLDGAIPFSEYSFGDQMPVSGENYIIGGFDPPRVMLQKGVSAFGDLWQSFRELTVAHYVKDMASIARAIGFPKKQYYTHQIPADYLFGTRPNDPAFPYLNPRYYSSASPMWTANAFSDIGMAITLYDLKIDSSTFWRTSKYAVPAIQGMSSNWAALEYNPDVHITTGIPASPVQDIYNQMIRLYQYKAHIISFFSWLENEEWQYKDTNRELAAVQLFNSIKDCARQPVGTLFTPPAVSLFSGAFNASTGDIDLNWSEKIWSDLSHHWSHWGGFKEFIVYRGTSPDFVGNSSSEIARIKDTSFSDGGFSTGGYIYYKIEAVNTAGTRGPLVSLGPIIPEIGPIAILNVSRSSFIFSGKVGGESTSPQQFMVINNGTADMNWSVVSNSNWLQCNPSFGINSQVLTVSVNPAILPAGTYSGTLTVNAPGAYESPRYITVSLSVVSSTDTQPPIGYWDTPLDGATQVRGQIPITGWALDDIEVDRVEIWRRAEPEDPPGAIAPDGLVFVGTALLVEGARPNLETDYPYSQYPYNYKGGWGYMMLTYGLPRRGSGEYLLYAFVWDVEGKKTSLGTKTISCDNENAVKPFGTLDTPAPGMAFPDSTYGNINFGWVLTPQPKFIPYDGSTIFVYIDGVLKGTVYEYGNYSASVAEMFPGYANTNSSYGHYLIDLDSYENGVHTIQWTAYDSQGVGEGIGSRYFNIQNAGTSGSSIKEQGGRESREFTERYAPIESKGLSGISESVLVRKGYQQDGGLLPFYPDNRGMIEIQIAEVDRVEIHLPKKTGETNGLPYWTAHHVVGEQLRMLPVGSTFVPEKGSFYWQPGAGFIGDYSFVFTQGNHQGICREIRIVISIIPKNVPEKHNPADPIYR